jgi:CBS domain-containing protein
MADDATTPTETPVSEIMQTEVLTIGPDATVHELAELMRNERVGGVPVVASDGRLVGIATEGDLVAEDADLHYPHFIQFLDGVIYMPGAMHRYEEKLKKMVGNTVGDVMTQEVLTVKADDPASKAATFMSDKGINRVPVVDDDDRLIGLVTRMDVIKMLGI